MLDLKIAGLIIEPTQSALPNPNLDLYQQIAEYKIPTILFHSTYPTLKFPTLLMDDQGGERDLVNYLFQLGHRNIIGVFQVDDQQGLNRMNGLIQAYQESGIPLTNSNMIMYQSSDSFTSILEKVDNLLSSPDHPTAIACYNDQFATYLINHLQKRGVRVPEDVSVVGFDDYEMAQIISPTLTTVEHPKREMGKDAAEMLMRMSQGEEVTSKLYPAPLVKRESAKNISKGENS